MTERRLVDTNLIIRALVPDHEKHTMIARKLFEACDRGEILLVVLPAVLAECVFVLASFYKHARSDIARALGDLISSPGIELSDTAIHLDALVRFGESNSHFVDCIIAAYAAAQKVPVATFDKGFRKFAGVTVRVDWSRVTSRDVSRVLLAPR